MDLTWQQKLTEIFQRSLLGVLLDRLSVHQVVEALAVLQEVVDSAHHTEDSEGEDVDTDDGNDGSLTTDEPTEDSEHGGDDVDGDDSAGQLPRRN